MCRKGGSKNRVSFLDHIRAIDRNIGKQQPNSSEKSSTGGVEENPNDQALHVKIANLKRELREKNTHVDILKQKLVNVQKQLSNMKIKNLKKQYWIEDAIKK